MRNLLMVILLFWTIACCAQEQGSIKGQLTSDEGQIEFATLILKAVQDSSIVKTALSGLEGEYEFVAVAYGTYFLEVLHLGYRDYRSEEVILNTPSYTFPSIMMSAEANVLEAAVVTSKRAFIERKIDRTVVNVEGSLLAAGGSAVDVLNTAPGINVNRDGNISLAGKNGVLVFIDGKRTFLSGSSLTSYLDNLSSEELSQIEIMSTPPASFDAAGNAGVINIKTKRSMLKGYTGSVGMSYRQGKYPVLRQNTNFNYRNNAFRLFANLGLNQVKGFEDLYITRNLRDETTLDLLTIYDQTTGQVNSSKSLNARLGVDYYIGERATIGVSGSFNTNQGDVEIDNFTTLNDPQRVILESIQAPGLTETDWDNANVNLNFRQDFDSTNHALFVDLDYGTYSTSTEQSIKNYFFDGEIEENESPSSTSEIFNQFPQEIDIYSGKIDYIRPAFSGRGKLEFGLKSSYVNTDNVFDFYNVDQASNLTLDSTLSNHFTYKEFVNAAYANASLKLNKRWAVQAGLRLETTNGEGQQLTTNESFVNDYVELFPSVYFTYNLDENNVLGMSYGRRIERPAYADLNPFRVYLDQFTFEEGNPLLTPQFSNNFELSFMGPFRATAYYNNIDNVIMSSISQNVENNETFIRPENLANNKVYGAHIDANLPLADFITSSIFLNVFRSQTEGTLNELPFSIAQTTFSGSMINTINMGKGWQFSMGAWYTSKSAEGTFIRNPYGRLGLAVQKSFWDRSATIRVSANDPFRWDKFVGTSNFQNIDLSGKSNWQTRTLRVSFTYKFRKGKIKNREERASSNSEEADRVKLK